MPILVTDYTWNETETNITLTVPLRGVKTSKVDIFTSNTYIKINFPPYYFEAHLFGTLIEEQCNVRVGNGVVLFDLVKEEKKLWGQLVLEELSAEEKTERRQAAIDKSHQKYKEEKMIKAKKKKEEEMFAVKEAMRLEQEDKERIEKEKQDERDKATSELEKWKEHPPTKQRDVWTGKVVDKGIMPPPRTRGEITVHFTHRSFTNPARESKAEEEQEWLTKMATARKINPFPEGTEKEESINERNPEFLKDKGNKFFKSGNYQAAINAYSQALKLNTMLPSLYSNRAACYLSTGELDNCITDCCKALELYYPVVSSNVNARTKVFARRGTAYARLEEYQLALQDYEAAVSLAPNDGTLQKDYENLKQYLMTSNTQRHNY